MEKQFKKEVAQETVDYIQRLQYEAAGMQEIISLLIENHKNDKDASFLQSPVYREYASQYAAVKAEYEAAKGGMESACIPPEAKKIRYDWNLDFNTNMLTVKYREAGDEA